MTNLEALVRALLPRPLPPGSTIPIQGRVKECANLIGPADSLLDIGCGPGWMAPLAKANGVKHYTGLDRDMNGDRFVAPEASFVAGSALALPFEGSRFDAVSLFDVIEHLPRGTESIALSEAHRVLRPGGRLYLSTPHASPLHTALDPLLIFGHRHYRKSTVSRLATKAGFVVEKLYVAGNMAESLAFIRLLAYRYFARRWPPERRFITRQIENGYLHNKRMGTTIFLVGRAAEHS